MSTSTNYLRCFCAFFLVVIVLVGSYGLSITSIVLGAININSNCSGIKHLAVYLITIGALGITNSILHASRYRKIQKTPAKSRIITATANNTTTEDTEDTKDSTLFDLIQIACAGVFIWGAVIVFGSERPSCDRVMYDFAFAVIILDFAVIGIYILFAIFKITSICDCKFACCGKIQSYDTNNSVRITIGYENTTPSNNATTIC